MSKKLVTYLEAIVAVSIWGATFIASKIALRDIQPETLVVLRLTMGVIVLAAGVQWRGQWQKLCRRDGLALAGLGFLGISFHQWLQSTGLVTSAASTTAWILTTSPMFIVVIGWLVLREKAGWIQILGTILAAGGVILVVSRGDFHLSSIGQFGAPGDVLILISALNWAVFSVLSRKILQRLPSVLMMFFVMLFGLGFSSVLFIGQAGYQDIGNLSLNGWLAVTALGVFGSGLAYIAWYDALQNLPANQAGVFLYLEPLVTMVMARFILGEFITWATLLGGGVIIAGVWMVNRKPSIAG